MCHWKMGLNSDKTSKVFCINLTCNSAMHLCPILQLYCHSLMAQLHQKSKIHEYQNKFNSLFLVYEWQ